MNYFIKNYTDDCDRQGGQHIVLKTVLKTSDCEKGYTIYSM